MVMESGLQVDFRPVSVSVPSTGVLIFLTRTQTIVNDGPADVYISFTNIAPKSDDAAIKVNEAVKISIADFVDHKYWLRTSSGTATVRIFGTDSLTDVSLELKLPSGFTPVSKGTKHGYAATANTDIFASDIAPSSTPSLIRVNVMLETAGVFSAQLKNSTTKAMKFNSGIALAASCLYGFDMLVDSGDTVNFQTDTSGNVTLRILEIDAATQ